MVYFYYPFFLIQLKVSVWLIQNFKSIVDFRLKGCSLTAVQEQTLYKASTITYIQVKKFSTYR